MAGKEEVRRCGGAEMVKVVVEAAAAAAMNISIIC